MAYTYLDLQKKFSGFPIVPILLIDPIIDFGMQLDNAKHIVRALLNAGVKQVEILFRGENPELHEKAAAMLVELKRMPDFSEVAFGSGTIDTCDKMVKAVRARSDFLVSPDSRRDMLAFWCANYSQIPFYPTVLTTTELAAAVKMLPHPQIKGLKLFPANQVKDLSAYMASLKAIYPDVHFVLSYDRTTPDNIRDLKYSSVAAIAASWLIPNWAVQEKNWAVITQLACLAKEAAEIARGSEDDDTHLLLLRAKINEIKKVARIVNTKEQGSQFDEKDFLLPGFYTYPYITHDKETQTNT